MATSWMVPVAIGCVGVMGFAIQRGATCTVAAVDEVLTQRSARRLMAMFEASLWVAGGLALAHLAHLAGSMPAGFEVTAWTVLGGALLGFGAWVNRACVFGAVARLGSGEWAYAATPLGFFVGCLSVMPLFSRSMTSPLSAPSPLLQASTAFAVMFVAFALWRLRPGIRVLRGTDRIGALGQRIWAPHAATVVIGVCFVITLLLAGRWAYTDVLADLAQAMDAKATVDAVSLLPVLLLLALYAGAFTGGLTAGRWRAHPRLGRAVAQVLRRRRVDGLGQPADPRRQRRADPDRHAAAAPLRLARVRQHVRHDRAGNADRPRRLVGVGFAPGTMTH